MPQPDALPFDVFSTLYNLANGSIGNMFLLVVMYLLLKGKINIVLQALGIVEEKVEKVTDNTKINGWLEALIMSAPFPMWVKIPYDKPEGGVGFKMLYVNQQYTEWFGVPNSRYAGRTDFEVWPKDVAIAYEKHDAMVYTTRRDQRFLEPISTSLHGVPGEHDGQVMEFEKRVVTKDDMVAIVGSMRTPYPGAPAVAGAEPQGPEGAGDQ